MLIMHRRPVSYNVRPMRMTLNLMDIFHTLEFSQAWIDLGIITLAKLEQLETAWATGEDKNTEHYRWGTFLDFVKSQESLDEKTAKALYDLGANDPDIGMAGAIMANILHRKDCPRDLLEKAAESDKKFLQKISTKKLAALS